MIQYLVRFAVNKYNLLKSGRYGESPLVEFTGVKPIYSKDMNLCFGDCVELYNHECVKNNAMQSRSDTCIALFPAGNTYGSWYFMNISTKRLVCRTNWKKIFTSRLIIETMNKFADDRTLVSLEIENDSDGVAEKVILGKNILAKDVLDIGTSSHGQNLDKIITSDMEAIDIGKKTGVIANPSELRSNDVESQDISISQNVDSDDTLLVNYHEDDAIEGGPSDVIKRSLRLAAKAPINYDLNKGDNFALNLSIKKGINLYGDLAVKGIKSELQQMVKQNVWNYLYSYDGRYIRSSMFLKEKMDLDGNLLKIKARLVADGSTQELPHSQDTYSPTLKSCSLMCLLKIAISEKRIIASVDISGAYLHAPMMDDVYMKLDKSIVDQLTEVDESCRKYRRFDGSLLVKLNKALYGCKQSGMLWYERIRNYLISIGFLQNKMDECVFNITMNGYQLSVGLYVDDLIITSISNSNIVWLKENLKKEFKDITEQNGDTLSYLGLLVERDNYGAKISMPHLVNDLLFDFHGNAVSPAKEDLFEISDSELLGEKEAEIFHSTTAKLLYLANKVRLDLMLAVSFLATRVCAPTLADNEKLNRVLKYLNSTRYKYVRISNTPISGINGMIDASFATHADGKSHTGEIILLGDCVVKAKSSKQHIVTKDSTEAELVGLSDKMLDVVCINDFLNNQGLLLNVPIISQDNKSTIRWTEQKSRALRNKYLLVRQELVKQSIENGDFAIEYLCTKDMLADIMTKPLHGATFEYLRDKIAGCDSEKETGVTDEEVNAPKFPHRILFLSHNPCPLSNSKCDHKYLGKSLRSTEDVGFLGFNICYHNDNVLQQI
jgi:hypothetical protein